ncbi:MAG: DUF5615 family PIN-like protein, partial [Nitrospirales bacterium]
RPRAEIRVGASRVKLLFDENLSPRLIALLSSTFPKSCHVRDVGLARADDDTVWSYAKDQGLVIVSKDSDFHQRSFVLGFPPKVVWIRRGNCTTKEIANLRQAHQSDLLVFASNTEAAFLELG